MPGFRRLRRWRPTSRTTRSRGPSPSTPQSSWPSSCWYCGSSARTRAAPPPPPSALSSRGPSRLSGFPAVVDGPGWRIVILFAFVSLFAVGETIVAPTRNPLINSLADDRIRGRANSISGFSQAVALIVSPAIVTGLLAAHLGAVWIALLCLGCLGTVAIAARLRVTLTAEQDFAIQPPVAESPAG